MQSSSFVSVSPGKVMIPRPEAVFFLDQKSSLGIGSEQATAEFDVPRWHLLAFSWAHRISIHVVGVNLRFLSDESTRYLCWFLTNSGAMRVPFADGLQFKRELLYLDPNRIMHLGYGYLGA